MPRRRSPDGAPAAAQRRGGTTLTPTSGNPPSGGEEGPEPQTRNPAGAAQQDAIHTSFNHRGTIAGSPVLRPPAHRLSVHARCRTVGEAQLLPDMPTRQAHPTLSQEPCRRHDTPGNPRPGCDYGQWSLVCHGHLRTSASNSCSDMIDRLRHRATASTDNHRK